MNNVSVPAPFEVLDGRLNNGLTKRQEKTYHSRYGKSYTALSGSFDPWTTDMLFQFPRNVPEVLFLCGKRIHIFFNDQRSFTAVWTIFQQYAWMRTRTYEDTLIGDIPVCPLLDTFGKKTSMGATAKSSRLTEVTAMYDELWKEMVCEKEVSSGKKCIEMNALKRTFLIKIVVSVRLLVCSSL